MYEPSKNEHLYLYRPCGNPWVSDVRTPYTVSYVMGNTCVVREAKLIFNGVRYYDTLPDAIEDDPSGRALTLRWSEKHHRWQESPAGSYPRVAVFGEWDFYPYLD